MSSKEREHGERARPTPAPDPEAERSAEGIDATRAGAERLLRAADEAIARALSSDSERFLQATRQSGGQ